MSKRGRRLTKTMKKIEHHDSSEEEELVFKSKAKEAEEESDPEEFPPGAPEVRSSRVLLRAAGFFFSWFAQHHHHHHRTMPCVREKCQFRQRTYTDALDFVASWLTHLHCRSPSHFSLPQFWTAGWCFAPHLTHPTARHTAPHHTTPAALCLSGSVRRLHQAGHQNARPPSPRRRPASRRGARP